MVKINVYFAVQICSQQGTGGKTFDLKLTKVPCGAPNWIYVEIKYCQ